MSIDRGVANLDMIVSQMTNRINKRSEHQIRTEVRSALRTCITCEHFDNGAETCKLTDNLRPPAKVIAYGCDKYKDYTDDIPF